MSMQNPESQGQNGQVEGGFDPARHLSLVKGQDKRRAPKSAEHRQKISAALKEYARRKDSHLHDLHKEGPESPAFKTGIQPDYYRRIAFEAHGKICNRCRRDDVYLVVHHINENRHDNDIANLEVLCMSCHLKHHRNKKG